MSFFYFIYLFIHFFFDSLALDDCFQISLSFAQFPEVPVWTSGPWWFSMLSWGYRFTIWTKNTDVNYFESSVTLANKGCFNVPPKNIFKGLFIINGYVIHLGQKTEIFYSLLSIHASGETWLDWLSSFRGDTDWKPEYIQLETKIKGHPFTLALTYFQVLG